MIKLKITAILILVDFAVWNDKIQWKENEKVVDKVEIIFKNSCMMCSTM